MCKKNRFFYFDLILVFLLSIYVIYSNSELTCDNPSYSNVTQFLSVTCRTDNSSFNKSDCSGIFQNSISSENVSTIDTQPGSINKDGQVQCIFQQAIGQFTEGSYTLYVTFTSPNGLTEDYSFVIRFEKPTLEFSNCEGDTAETYLAENSTYNCECIVSNKASLYPPISSVTWSGSSVSYPHSDSYTLLQFKAFRDETYTCKAFSPLKNGTVEKVHDPRIAFGPTQLSISVYYENSPTTASINFCNGVNDILIKCAVNPKDVNPGYPQFEVYANDVYLGRSNSSLHGSVYTTERVYQNVNRYEKLTFKCIGVNSEFDTLSLSMTTERTVQKPPSRPYIRVSGTLIDRSTQEITFMEGSTESINCFASGGYPMLSKLILNCGGQKFERNNTDSFTSNIMFTKEMNGSPCKCEGHHITGCYSDNLITLTLNILYNARIIEFTANDVNQTYTKSDDVNQSYTKSDDVNQTYTQRGEVTTYAGNLLEISCKVDGNPEPQVRIEMYQSQINDQYAGSFWRRYMKCGDTDKFTCLVDNKNGQNSAKEMFVYVKCPIEVKNSSIEQETIILWNGEHHYNFVLDVLGYPAPTEQDLSITKDSMFIKNYDIKIDFENNMTSNGLLNFTLFDLSQEESGNYTVFVAFENDTRLLYTFFLVIPETPNVNTEASFSPDLIYILTGTAAAVLCLTTCIILYISYRRNSSHSSKFTEIESIKSDGVDKTEFDVTVRASELHVTDNSEVYNMGKTDPHLDGVDNLGSDSTDRDSYLHVTDNSEVYNMGKTDTHLVGVDSIGCESNDKDSYLHVTDNSEVYNMGKTDPLLDDVENTGCDSPDRDSYLYVTDNSEVYNMGKTDPHLDTKDDKDECEADEEEEEDQELSRDITPF